MKALFFDFLGIKALGCRKGFVQHGLRAMSSSRSSSTQHVVRSLCGELSEWVDSLLSEDIGNHYDDIDHQIYTKNVVKNLYSQKDQSI